MCMYVCFVPKDTLIFIAIAIYLYMCKYIRTYVLICRACPDCEFCFTNIHIYLFVFSHADNTPAQMITIGFNQTSSTVSESVGTLSLYMEASGQFQAQINLMLTTTDITATCTQVPLACIQRSVKVVQSSYVTAH